MRLAFVMPLWGRHVLTRLVLEQWHRQILRLRGTVDVHLVCVGSEGARSSALVSGLSDGISYVEADNDPLNRKWNKGVAVTKFLNPDGVCIIGSDNLLSDNLFVRWAELLQAGQDFFGLRDLYFFHAATLTLGYWPGYALTTDRHLEPVGAARCHSRRVMEAVDWQLWPDEPARNTVLDRASREHIDACCCGLQPTSYTLADLKAKAVDIKAEGNITAWDRLRMAHAIQGSAAVGYLADLVDDSTLRTLTTHWRTAA